jgi:uncharacterized membrane protein YczE
MKRVLLQWLQIAAGLLVFAFGVHLTIFANIGLAPWDCLGMGVAAHTPLNYGLSMTAIALAVLGIDLLLKERIGFGTIIDALLTGNFVQMFSDLNPLPLNDNPWLGIALMTVGFVFMALQLAGQSTFQALCDARHAIFFSLLRKAIIVVPLTLLLPRLGFGVLGVFLAEPISNVIGGLASYITMRMTVYKRVVNAIKNSP